MNNADLNVGTIYFTDTFLANDEEKAALVMKGTAIITNDGTVVAEGFVT